MAGLKVALVGAGSRSFGPGTVRDVLLSDVLAENGVELVLMDISDKAVQTVRDYADWVKSELGRDATVTHTTSLEEALEGADFVVDAIEISRDVYWAMDYHIPRQYGFKQIFGENGGPGSLFHALRNMRPIVDIAKAMERVCPEATLLNYTNPMHKLCEAATRLSNTKTVGLCHGIGMGMGQVSNFLKVPIEDLDVVACGLNHFTFFQQIRRKSTNEDLYPELKKVEKEADPLYDWHEIALSRVILRRYGLYPSPGANHIGEYIAWADEFFAGQMHWYHDPMGGRPWETGIAPEFVYSMGAVSTHRPVVKEPSPDTEIHRGEIWQSGEVASLIMEAKVTGSNTEIDAVNVPNAGFMPGLPEGTVVELPATADGQGLHPHTMDPLPEPIAVWMRTQASIQKLLVEAYVEESKEKLLQAVLMEPTVDSYRNAVAMVDDMLRLQADILPPIH